MVINGERGTVSRIDVLDSDIPTAAGGKIGTPFSDLQQTFGHCSEPVSRLIAIPASNVKPREVSASS